MAVTINAKGTTVQFFRIGKNGTTLYQGSSDPSISYTISEGDYWLDTTDNSIKSYVSSMWQSINLGNFSFSANTMSTTNTNGDINLSPDGTGEVNVQTNCVITGDCSADNFIDTSSIRFKKDVSSLTEDRIDSFDELNPVTYTWSKEGKYGEVDIGFIAEEVNELYPELVLKDEFGLCTGINYGKLTSVLTAKIQRQQKEINDLSTENHMIKLQMDALNDKIEKIMSLMKV